MEHLNQQGIDEFGKWLANFHRNTIESEKTNDANLFCNMFNSDLIERLKELEKENNYLKNKLKEYKIKW